LIWSAGPTTKLTVGYGVCDPDYQSVGHTAWSPDPYTSFADDGGVSADRTMHIREKIGTLIPGESVSFSFVFVGGKSPSDVVDAYYKALEGGICCNDCEWTDDEIKKDYSVDARDVSGVKAKAAREKVETPNDRASIEE